MAGSGQVGRGNLLTDEAWEVRHRVITRLALAQAAGLALFALVVGRGVPAALVALVVPGLPALAGLLATRSRWLRMLSVVTSLMFASATLVDLTDGLTEAHFHFFVMLGVVSLYQDWAAFGLCVLVTVAHHAIMGIAAPGSVFAGAAQRADPVRWAAVHGGFILAASLTHVVAWRFSEQVWQRDPRLVTVVAEVLHEAGLAPHHLIVEVTETVLLADLDVARRQLGALRTLGIQVAIDDFGTGYSSPSFLRRPAPGGRMGA